MSNRLRMFTEFGRGAIISGAMDVKIRAVVFPRFFSKRPSEFMERSYSVGLSA